MQWETVHRKITRFLSLDSEDIKYLFINKKLNKSLSSSCFYIFWDLSVNFLSGFFSIIMANDEEITTLDLRKAYNVQQTNLNVYIFPSPAHVTLTSSITFGGKKMQSGMWERCFSSIYFTPKNNYSKESGFRCTTK